MKLICLLALALFSGLAEAQLFRQPHQPQQPNQHQLPQPPSESFHTCNVADNYKIQCGVPSISAAECEAIKCCFDGHMCYYGKSVTLQCTKDGQMIVVVARDATLPNIDVETVSFLGNDQNCNPAGITSAFVIYQFPVTGCGTVMMEEPGVIIYENRMTTSYEVAIGPHGLITRDSFFEVQLQCRYIGTTIEALIVEVGTADALPPIAAPGPLRVELRLANGQCTGKGCVEEKVAYSSFYEDSDYPVIKVLRDPVYVEVRMLERTDPNIVLTLGRCWATADPHPHSFPQWDLLIDGCPYADDNYKTTLVPVDSTSGLMYPSHYRRFIFKMFTFVSSEAVGHVKEAVADASSVMTPLKEKVYIHCETAVCQPYVGDNCEPRCLRKRRSTDRGVFRPVTNVVSSKEIIIIDKRQN